MNWSSLREEGLLVSLEGEGGELVSYPSLQECAIWFENGEPCHTLFFYLFHSSMCACQLSLPSTSHLLLHLSWAGAGLRSVCSLISQLSAAGLNDVVQTWG